MAESTIIMSKQALKLDEDNEKIKALLKDAQLTWEADFD